MAKLEGYRRKIYLAIILISLGVVMNTTLNTALGTVLIAVGGLFFIIGMNDKKMESEENAVDEKQ